jgi:hypothetical protein
MVTLVEHNKQRNSLPSARDSGSTPQSNKSTSIAIACLSSPQSKILLICGWGMDGSISGWRQDRSEEAHLIKPLHFCLSVERFSDRRLLRHSRLALCLHRNTHPVGSRPRRRDAAQSILFLFPSSPSATIHRRFPYMSAQWSELHRRAKALEGRLEVRRISGTCILFSLLFRQKFNAMLLWHKKLMLIFYVMKVWPLCASVF